MDEETAFKDIKDRIFRERSLDVNQYKENYLKRRLAVRMRALHLKSYHEYSRYLEGNREEYNMLFDKLTINVTQFFRDPEVFVELENSIFPEIFRKTGYINAWSAGCSSGEEPYSIAVSIEESKKKFNSENIKYMVYATDLDDVSLRRAVEGSYGEKPLENIADKRKKRYFDYENCYRVKDFIKKNVKFIRMNIMEPYKKEFFDLIFCRNVIIYFGRELQKIIMGYFFRALKPGGFLFMGKTETMVNDFRDRFECINVKERIFKKKG